MDSKSGFILPLDVTRSNFQFCKEELAAFLSPSLLAVREAFGSLLNNAARSSQFSFSCYTEENKHLMF